MQTGCRLIRRIPGLEAENIMGERGATNVRPYTRYFSHNERVQHGR